MEELKINLSIDEINLILNGLSELPFKTVNELIGKITYQVGNQFKDKQSKDVFDSESIEY